MAANAYIKLKRCLGKQDALIELQEIALRELDWQASQSLTQMTIFKKYAGAMA